MANQNVLQLTQQTTSADSTSVFYAVINGTTDTGLPFSVLVNNLGLTGTPTCPTATTGTNTGQIASTSFVHNTAALYAPLTGATFTGAVVIPTVTISGGTINSTSVGATTPSTGAFTTLSASSTVSGTGFSTYLASPPAIGSTTASSGAFTTLSASSTVSGTGFSTYLASPPAIGGTAANSGAFTTLSASGTVSGTGFSTYLLTPPPIGTTTPAAGKFTTLQATGAITPSSTAGVVGTTTNDNANAGSIGEYASNSTLTTALTSGTAANATSISLTAGDWDVEVIGRFNPGGSATTSNMSVGVSTTSATFGAFGTFVTNTIPFGSTTSTPNTMATPVVRISLAATTTVYAVALCTFSASTMTADGFIRARRIR